MTAREFLDHIRACPEEVEWAPAEEWVIRKRLGGGRGVEYVYYRVSLQVTTDLWQAARFHSVRYCRELLHGLINYDSSLGEILGWYQAEIIRFPYPQYN